MTQRVLLRSGLVSLLLAGACAARAVAGLDPESNTDGYDPAADSYRINEARRLNAISQQLELTRQMLWLNGFNPANPPVRQPIGYESGPIGPNRWMYRPLYAEDVPAEMVPPPGPEALPVPSASGPLLIPQGPAPAGAQPGDFIPPQDAGGARPGGGPREF